MKIIFISGIHGSGKTTLGASLSKELNIPLFSASKLIYDSKNASPPSDKRVQNINYNQILLMDALKHLQNDLIILEGHTCLIDSQNRVQRISPSVFESLNISCIVFVRSEVQSSAVRLQVRDGYIHSIKLLSRLQKEEWNYLQWIKEIKGIPLFTFDSTMDPVEFSKKFMKNL